jgi:hypothetical protein
VTVAAAMVLVVNIATCCIVAFEDMYTCFFGMTVFQFIEYVLTEWIVGFDRSMVKYFGL